jgi:hypothetical protein
VDRGTRFAVVSPLFVQRANHLTSDASTPGNSGAKLCRERERRSAKFLVMVSDRSDLLELSLMGQYTIQGTTSTKTTP